MTFLLLARAVATTAAASLRVLCDSARGALTPESADVHIDRWSRALLGQVGLELDVVGREKAPRAETFVVMSNHQSLYDIPVLLQSLDQRMRMIAKTELFKVPLWSTAMRRCGFIELDRANRSRAADSLRAAEAALSSGTSIWIAPEGTRSLTGQLLPFKKGGFHLALAARARILPVTIDGTRNVLPAKGRRIRRGLKVRVILGDPIDTKDFRRRDLERLAQQVRAAIQVHLPEPGATGEGPVLATEH
ncbi:MAG: 1-acyl-sn-glycerol-3-phosphate acyltransferase [Polyangiaceae bacterium]|nr:1-acyl-sn-glycerol-3-phosphate acyltransferase [Polyangiaceae bacterium]